jgi:integrase
MCSIFHVPSFQYVVWLINFATEPSIATHLLDAGADLAFGKDWLGHANSQNTTIYAQLTNPTRDDQARRLFMSHKVV